MEVTKDMLIGEILKKDQTIAAMAMSYQMPAEQLREMMGERGVAMVAEDILSKQALEFIVKEAVEA